MLKADIKLPIALPIITIIAAIAFSFFGFSPMTVIIYIGTLYILVYYLTGYLRRRDALLINEKTIQVKTPFRIKEFEIDKFDKVYIVEGHTQIKGVITVNDEEKTVTICSAIYTVSIDEIYNTIISNKEKTKV